MAIEIKTFFRRPRPYADITAAKVEMAVKRAVAADKVRQVKVNLYFVEGWWNKLGTEQWKVHDAMTYLLLGFGKRFVDGKEKLPGNVDSDPILLRRESKFLRLVANVAGGIADEIDRRAELLELESVEEAAD